MKILLTCLNFKKTTGSELYYYDLACALVDLGHDVSILSNMEGGFLYQKAERRHIKCYDFSQAPKDTFDIIIGSHRPVLNTIINDKMYGDTPIISINHSEIIDFEYPIIDIRIKHYIAIRESIQKFLEERYYIDSGNISMIYNPINKDKLLSAKKRTPKKKTVVFPATVDYLRKNAIKFMCDLAKKQDFNLVIIGEKIENYLDEYMNENCAWEPAVWEIQRYYANATHTAGIQFGRTQIEGYFFGLPCYQFTVDKLGAVYGMSIVEPMKDLTIFESKNVARQIIQVCEKVLSNESVNNQVQDLQQGNGSVVNKQVE